MLRKENRWMLFSLALLLLPIGALIWISHGCGHSQFESGDAPSGDAGTVVPPCSSGIDLDKDGYGVGCSVGEDCDDDNVFVHPNAPEVCDYKDNDCDGQIDEGVLNACGTCDVGCGGLGQGTPFPMDPGTDSNLKEKDGVQLTPEGDLTLDSTTTNFHYLWISNTYDTGASACGATNPSNPSRCRGTVSKVDSTNIKEIARYYTTVCTTKSGATNCLDVNGAPIVQAHNHTPSRTAVDYNMDVWVANRSVHGGQPSVTKIANDPRDCIDRNGNKQIDTSADRDGDGKINIDCNGDGAADSLSTVCTGSLAGKQPEFLGDDDECLLFTTNYADDGDKGRSVCLDTGKNTIGPSDAWVGTYSREANGRGPNQFYKINGANGKIEVTVNMPAGHKTYGCMADAFHTIWSTDIGVDSGGGSLVYFNSMSPNQVGKKLVSTTGPKAGKPYYHYGITVGPDGAVWLGGWTSEHVLRYKPKRDSFSTLGDGTWTRIDLPNGMWTRGIAADDRGKIWVAIHQGAIFRLDQNLADGVHNKTAAKENEEYWKTKASVVIGAGVDLTGNLWGIGHGNNFASRLDVDKSGNVVSPPTAQLDDHNITLGQNPYTYSDFTGFGLINFIRPAGRYTYQYKLCPDGQYGTINLLSWKATTPDGTAINARVRTSNDNVTWGNWTKVFESSPATLAPGTANEVSPNPADYIQIEFSLITRSKTSAPILHEYTISQACSDKPI